MPISDIVVETIDKEITKLRMARELLTGENDDKGEKRKYQRKAVRVISEAGRKRIAKAQRERWAKIRASKKN